MGVKFKMKLVISICCIFIVLYSVTAFFIYGNLEVNSKTNNLLNSSSQIIFGKSIVNNGHLDVTLDEIGVALVLFPNISFKTVEFSQLDLSIENLPKNYQAKLVILSKERREPTELSLLQPNGELQSNLLIKDYNWAGDVQQIGLRILPQNELGLSQPFDGIIKVNSLILNNKGYLANYFTLYNYWIDYEPWEYLSISHLKTKPIIPVYAQPLIFIIIWVILCLIILKIIKIKVIFVIFFIAWVSLDLLFLNNMKNNKDWVDSIYNQGEKPLPDDDLLGISIDIKSILSKENFKSHINKILILTPDKYQGIRLVYHLLPLNAGFLNTFLPSKDLTEGDYILSYAKDGAVFKPEFNMLEQGDVKIKIEIISKGEGYILMSVGND